MRVKAGAWLSSIRESEEGGPAEKAESTKQERVTAAERDLGDSEWRGGLKRLIVRGRGRWKRERERERNKKKVKVKRRRMNEEERAFA